MVLKKSQSTYFGTLIVEKSGFFEKFNPLSGEGLGHHPQSWTAAILSMKHELE
ncbi:MAG: hypothetical protein QXL15_02430 [Candidatus Korarchaeota archaeon]